MNLFIKSLSVLGLTAALLTSLQASAQTDNVGIGTITPEPSAILDIANPYNVITGTPAKGLLIPSLNQIQRDGMQAAYNDTIANGLLIYESDSGFFWYYRYNIPTPASAPYGSWTKLSIQQPAGSQMPSGGIIMWSGTIASIPVGWALCDGANGTPDLTDKFILSVTSSAENPGTAAVPNQFVTVAGTQAVNDRRFFKLAYIMKL
jgi:hypothetical protein